MRSRLRSSAPLFFNAAVVQQAPNECQQAPPAVLNVNQYARGNSRAQRRAYIGQGNVIRQRTLIQKAAEYPHRRADGDDEKKERGRMRFSRSGAFMGLETLGLRHLLRPGMVGVTR
ncbi:hypothetical protein [Massilia frigida]|uniref:hypothetical protein n=1 Tax=Massilia frigida TaxID=2609281 RepID=UPI001CB6D47D|nr:hypothetical protein [Massilia frigida]